MQKYLLVIQNTWNETLTYRINFIMWRVRTSIQLLTIYLLWFSVIPQNGNLFGYSQSQMLTYILATSIVTAIVFATRTHEIAQNINEGDLSIFILKPWGYFTYWFFRDIGDKLMNIVFMIGEFIILFYFLKPPIYYQTDILVLFFTFICLIVAIFLNFFISCLIGLIGFWSPDVWAPRFLFYVILSFFTGSYFPLDILPKTLQNTLSLLPFPYLMYFPIKIYLGHLNLMDIISGLIISLMWVLLIYFALSFVWKKGIKNYNAYGR